jgi:glycosyltransferase involved in cell wall biosynthesis
MAQPRILIGMPAFRGADLIHEALQSISNQDHRDFRVLISIDGNDSETAAACQPFLADARFSLVMQDRRLGWAGNINWLMSQPDYDFFCYWQHDDFTSANYISELLRSSITHPSAVCYFCGIQWTGQLTSWVGSSSVVGLPITRAISIFDSLNGIPLRGLIRREAINRTGPIRITDYESAFEEYVWVGKLAREGELQYVEGPTYFKRARGDSTHTMWHKRDRLWRRAVWLEFGLGMLETIWPLVLVEPERIAALCNVLDRLCLPKKERFFFYDGPTIPFASDFLLKALERFPMPSLERAMTGAQPESFAGGLVGELLDRAIQFSKSRREASAKEQNTFRFRAGDAGIDLLLDGWSFAETWGTWSDGPRAGLRLPVGGMRGPWKAIITFRAFGKGGTVPVEITVPSSPQITTARVAVNQVVRIELRVESDATDILLRFAFPGATSPMSLGVSNDRRNLGIGLISMDLTEPA